MQRRMGNAYVQRSLAQGTSQVKKERVPSGVEAATLQRQAQSTPEEDFLNDLKSGTEKAAEYVDFITKSVEYWQKTGNKAPGHDEAVANLLKITSSVKSRLDKFAGVVGKAKHVLEVKKWLESLDDLAAKTKALDMANRDTVVAWGKALQKNVDVSKPLIEVAQSWLKGLAYKGSAVAGRASLVLSVFTAYVEVGVAALNAGIRVEKLYFDRLDKRIAEANQVKKKEPPPPYPGDWSSAAESRKAAAAFKAYMARVAKQRAEERRRQDAIDTFNTVKFPKIYRRRRSRIKWRILRDLKTGRRRWKVTMESGSAVVPGLGASRWWDCFMDSGRPDYFDRVAGTNITPKLSRVNREQAQIEIDYFQNVEPSCPYFDRLYQDELKKYLARALKKP